MRRCTRSIWKLEQPALVDFTQGLAVTGLHIIAADAHLQAAGEVLPQLHVNAELTDATPGLIDAILPGYLDSGSFKATLQLQGSLAHPLGQLRLTGTDLRAPGDAGSLPPLQLTASADLANDGARITLHSSAGDATHMSVEGSIPWSGPLAVTASGNVDLARFNPLLESAGRRISGKIDVNAQVAGTLDVPTVKGSVQLHKGTIHDYRHGVDLTDIEGVLEGTQNQLRDHATDRARGLGHGRGYRDPRRTAGRLASGSASYGTQRPALRQQYRLRHRQCRSDAQPAPHCTNSRSRAACW